MRGRGKKHLGAQKMPCKREGKASIDRVITGPALTGDSVSCILAQSNAAVEKGGKKVRDEKLQAAKSLLPPLMAMG